MYERFTDRARSVMQLANREAQRFNHAYIGTEHILLGLIKEGSGVAANVLKNLDIDLRKVRLEVEKIVQTGPGGAQVLLGKLPHTPHSKKVIEYSVEEARSLNHNYVGTEHLLLGLLCEQEGIAAQVLINLGLKLAEVREEVLNLLGHNIHGHQERVPHSRSKTPTLDRYSSDLTDVARHGKLDPCIGRNAELASIKEILGCRFQRNPLLVGEPGVGKGMLVAGLAQSIVDGRLPDWLRKCRVVLLPLSRLWTSEDQWIRGADLARTVFNEVRRQDTILFLPDAVASLGSRAGGVASDRAHAELLLALRTDEVPCILTATPAGYRRCLERHPSLESLIQPLVVEPLTVEETVSVIRGVRERYRVHVHDDAVTALVEAADRELRGVLPGKAIRLLDRAAARTRDRAWQSSAEASAATGPLDTQLQELNRQKEDAVGARDFDRAAELRDRADAIRKEIDGLMQQLSERDQPSDSVVDLAIVAEVVRDMARDVPPSHP